MSSGLFFGVNVFMAEFISSFITGFQDVVAEDLPRRLKGVKIISVYDGLVHYRYEGNSHDLEKIIYFNNTFFVLKTMKGRGINFASLVNAVANEKKYYLISKGTFRVRFIQENQFAKVDKSLSRKAEETVLHNSRLQLDRLSPSTEIWYSIRREDFAFCGQLISKREFTEKNLNKGELRPEIAYFISCFANPCEEDTVLEPFCGYGSIPVQLAKKFRYAKLFVSDIDQEKVSLVKEKKQLSGSENISVSQQDAFVLDSIADRSISLVITDPPWGYYEDIGDIAEFYNRMFASFRRVLKEDGRMVILTARTEEFEQSCSQNNIVIKKSLHTLVNGKKASLYETALK